VVNNSLNTDQRCPTCGAEQFVIGPQGGMALNIKCVGCGAKWWFCPPFEPVAIDNDDQFYTAPPVILRDWMNRKVAEWLRDHA